MKISPSKLFHSPGYLPLDEYVRDIEIMRKNGPWKIPLQIGDRVHLFFLRMMRFSWFSDVLCIQHPHQWSPSYSILLSYLRKRGFVDEVVEKNANYGKYSFFFYKIQDSTLLQKCRYLHKFFQPAGFGYFVMPTQMPHRHHY